jgi:adiponectin receptor
MYQVVYLVIVVSLGVLAVVVSLWDKFGTPRYRPLRAGGHHRSGRENI